MSHRSVVLLLGPHRAIASGVCNHLDLLMQSALAEDFDLVRFQTCGAGRGEAGPWRWLSLLPSLLHLAATIVLRHAAIVHINTSLDRGTYWCDLGYLAVAKALGARVVYQVHGGELPQRLFARSALLTAFLRRTLAWPDLVVVLAQSELAAYREFVPQQPEVIALPYGVDCRPFGAVPTVRSESGHPLRLLYIGRVAREKGLYEAVQAMRVALELGVESRLVVAGRGPEEQRLRRYAQALGLAPRVTFVGSLHGSDEVKLLRGSDVIILPSHADGLPHALLDGMAAGIPVISTNVGAIPDVVSDGIHGFLVPPRDCKAIAQALAVLASDRERLSWMSRACRRRVHAAYSIDRVARELALRYAHVRGAIAPPARPPVGKILRNSASRPMVPSS